MERLVWWPLPLTIRADGRLSTLALDPSSVPQMGACASKSWDKRNLWMNLVLLPSSLLQIHLHFKSIHPSDPSIQNHRSDPLFTLTSQTYLPFRPTLQTLLSNPSNLEIHSPFRPIHPSDPSLCDQGGQVGGLQIPRISVQAMPKINWASMPPKAILASSVQNRK